MPVTICSSEIGRGCCPHPRVAAVAKKTATAAPLALSLDRGCRFSLFSAKPCTPMLNFFARSGPQDREYRQPLDRERDLNRRIEKRDAGSEWLQKDQKQNRQQKRADHAVDDAELAARRGSRFILERGADVGVDVKEPARQHDGALLGDANLVGHERHQAADYEQTAHPEDYAKDMKHQHPA